MTEHGTCGCLSASLGNNLTNSTSPGNGRQAIINIDHNIQLISVIGSAICAAIGIPGNVLTILTIWFTAPLHKVKSAFILSLTVADLIVTSYVIPVYSWLNNTQRTLSGIHCLLFAQIKYGTLGAAVLSLANISLNRYVAIVHRAAYKRLYTGRTMLASVALAWLVPHAIVALAVTETWGAISWNDKSATCTFTSTAEGRSFSLFYNSYLMLLPLVLMGFSYSRIAVQVSRSGQILRQAGGICNQGKTLNDIRLARTIAITLFFFFVTYLPFFVTLVIDADIKNVLARRIMALLMFSNSFINVFVYVLMNRVLRRAYWDLLRLRCRRARYYNDTSTTNVAREVWHGRTGNTRHTARAGRIRRPYGSSPSYVSQSALLTPVEEVEIQTLFSNVSASRSTRQLNVPCSAPSASRKTLRPSKRRTATVSASL